MRTTFTRIAGIAVALLSYNTGFAQQLQPNDFTPAQSPKLEEITTSTGTAPPVTIFTFTDKRDDFPGRMTTDAAGNFYVSAALELTELNPPSPASGFAVLKYNFNGKLEGAFRHKNAPGESQAMADAVKVDQHGNIYAAGNSSLGGLVVSFTATGMQRWAARFGGIAGNATALAIDDFGDIYVAGIQGHGGSDGVGPILEWAIAKYSNNGQLLWEQHHTGTADLDSRVTDIQLDPEGNPIVIGTTSNSLGTLTNKMTVVKFNPFGETLWAKDFGVFNNSLVPGGMAIDREGSVYATSMTNPPEGIATPFTVKYDPNGVLKFVLQGKDAGGRSITVDPAGDVLLTGDIVNFRTQLPFHATKIHPSGAQVWSTQIPGTGKILSDSVGNVFVAGTPSQVGYVITKLNTAGKVLFSFSVLPNDQVIDAVVDPFDNLLVTGNNADVQIPLSDIFTVRLE